MSFPRKTCWKVDMFSKNAFFWDEKKQLVRVGTRYGRDYVGREGGWEILKTLMVVDVGWPWVGQLRFGCWRSIWRALTAMKLWFVVLFCEYVSWSLYVDTWQGKILAFFVYSKQTGTTFYVYFKNWNGKRKHKP